MTKALTAGIVSLCLLMPSTSMAIDLYQYSQPVVTFDSDIAARATLLGIADACGTPTNVDDDCVLKGLERVSKEEGNANATAMLKEYSSAISEGQFYTQPECQVQTHLQANRILAHCTLLLNYAALKDQNADAATGQFNMCLQGGLQGLVFMGNVVAQFMLAEFYNQRGQTEQADIWKRAIKLRKDTDEYNLLQKCYG